MKLGQGVRSQGMVSEVRAWCPKLGHTTLPIQAIGRELIEAYILLKIFMQGPILKIHLQGIFSPTWPHPNSRKFGRFLLPSVALYRLFTAYSCIQTIDYRIQTIDYRVHIRGHFSILTTAGDRPTASGAHTGSPLEGEGTSDVSPRFPLYTQ